MGKFDGGLIPLYPDLDTGEADLIFKSGWTWIQVVSDFDPVLGKLVFKFGQLLIPAPAPARGTIRLDLSSITVNNLLARVHRIQDGLNGNVYFSDLTAVVTALTATVNDLPPAS